MSTQQQKMPVTTLPPEGPDPDPEEDGLVSFESPSRAPLTQWLLRQLQGRLGAVPLRFALWNGASACLSQEEPVATVRVKDPWTLVRLAMDPDWHFPEAYSNGRVEVEGDLVLAIEVVFRVARRRSPGATTTSGAGQKSVVRAAFRNARHHYDIGNDFYRLWLDEEMVYTCAYFPHPEASLEEAQVAKMDHVCRKLRIAPGDRVLEAGCGWGALARHMATRYGAQVVACNVSGEQIRYARERAAALGLGDRVRYIEDDFRNTTGQFDAFVSVGMLEHVGLENYGDLGRVIHERIDPERGRGLLHFIGRNRPEALNAWIRKRIFPGGYPPALSEVLQGVLEPWGFSVFDVENIRLHYAKTLQHWRERFEAAWDTAAKVLDERFLRAWRLYLAGSQAAFTTGHMQLFQITFGRGQDNSIAWTREGLYRLDAAEKAGATA
jgi:cyclopropane-fatty-acyl-phospholipid synthase